MTCLRSNAFKGVMVLHFIFCGKFQKTGSWFFTFCLVAFQVGYLSASIRSVADARVGDTITFYFRKAENSLPGYEEATPMVFCGLFPVDADQYCSLDQSLILELYIGSCCSLILQHHLFTCFIGRFPELRDALEKLQLNDAALKVNIIIKMLN